MGVTYVEEVQGVLAPNKAVLDNIMSAGCMGGVGQEIGFPMGRL